MDSKLKAGDFLYRSKGFVEHCGVYIGNDEVFHNSPANNTEIVKLSEFAEGKNVKVIYQPVKDKEELLVRMKMLTNKGTQYQWFANNCEQVSNMLLFGKAYSPQIKGAVSCAALAVAMARLNKVEGFGKLALAAIIGAGVGCMAVNAARKYDDVILPN